MAMKIALLLTVVYILTGCASGSGGRHVGAVGIITNNFDSAIVLIKPDYYPDKHAAPGQSVKFPKFVNWVSPLPPDPTCISLETPEGLKSYLIEKLPSWSLESFSMPSYAGPIDPKYRLVISEAGLFFVNESGSKKLEVQPIGSCSD